ncbi:MAG: polymerase beta, Nucleotidyltransferase [Bacteroidota bacterium]|jgi:predicted nucleotidyltransferase
MLIRQIIEEQIRQNAHRFVHLGISKIGLFGSYIHQEENEKSDIDILMASQKRVDFCSRQGSFLRK